MRRNPPPAQALPRGLVEARSSPWRAKTDGSTQCPATAGRRRTPGVAAGSPALVLCLAGLAQLRVGPVLEEQIRPFGVVEHAAQPVAEPRRGQPRRDPGL